MVSKITKVIFSRVPNEVHDALTKAAEDRKVNVSRFVRRMLTDWHRNGGK